MTNSEPLKEGDSQQPAGRYEGRPCKRCGKVTKYVSTQSCVSCVRDHAKKWLAEHPGKSREFEQRYLKKHPEAYARKLKRNRDRRARLGTFTAAAVPRPELDPNLVAEASVESPLLARARAIFEPVEPPTQ